MSDDNSKNNRFLFIAGIVTGAAAAIYFNTPHGKKVRNAIIEKADEVKSTVTEKASEFAETAKTGAKTAMDTASNKFSEVKDSAINVLDSANSTIDDVKSRFMKTAETSVAVVEEKMEEGANGLQAGVNNAKKKLGNIN